MKQVCQEYADANDLGAGQHRTVKAGLVIPTGLFRVASVFVAAQEARQQADYNLGVPVTHAQAEADVGRVESAFQEWLLVEAHAASNDFLAELWCRGIPKRN